MRRTIRLAALAAVLLPASGPTARAASPAFPPPALFVVTPDGRLAYDDTGGSGPLVLAVPGMGDIRQEFRYLTPLLKEAGYRVVTVDLRGFGASDAGWPDYSAHAVAHDLLRIEAHLGRAKAVLIGNSFAAGAAIWAAHDAPGRVRAIVLLAPVLRDPSTPAPWYMRIAMKLMFASPWRVRFWLHYWDSLFPTRRPPDQAAYRQVLKHNLQQPGRMRALQIMAQLSKAPTAAILGEATTPMLVVMGTRDPDFDDPAEEARWICGRTGAQLRMIAGAGHYPHVEMPERVGPAIVAFLGRLAP